MVAYRAKNSSELEGLLINGLDKVSNWLKQNKLTLNVKKTSFMTFGTSNMLNKMNDIQIKLQDANIKRESYTKYLGIIIDEKLSLEKHVEYIQRKVIPRLKLLGSLRNIVSKNTGLTIYKTMVSPLFDYCDVVLGTRAASEKSV